MKYPPGVLPPRFHEGGPEYRTTRPVSPSSSGKIIARALRAKCRASNVSPSHRRWIRGRGLGGEGEVREKGVDSILKDNHIRVRDGGLIAADSLARSLIVPRAEFRPRRSVRTTETSRKLIHPRPQNFPGNCRCHHAKSLLVDKYRRNRAARLWESRSSTCWEDDYSRDDVIIGKTTINRSKRYICMVPC